jgi:hypothetical protein
MAEIAISIRQPYVEQIFSSVKRDSHRVALILELRWFAD